MQLTRITNSSVVIIGAGASGTLVAARMLDAANRLGRRFEVHLVDPRRATGAGVAYSTDDTRHVLNVPVRGMSAYPDDPEHFLRWLELDAGAPVDANAYVPRSSFARYLAAVLDESAARCRLGSLHRVHAQAVAARSSSGGRCVVTLDDGSEIAGDACVLATGHLGSRTGWAPAGLRSSDRFISDPWADGALEGIPPEQDVLLVGAGLTAADVANTLARRGRIVHVTSRTGLLPHVHATQPLPKMEAPELPARASLPELRAVMRGHVARAKERYGDWRPAIDSVRALTQTLWSSMDEADKVAFLESDLRDWERARHRLCPSTAEALSTHERAGRVALHTGAVTGAVSRDGGIDVTLADGTVLDVGAVVNCCGPGASLDASRDRLLRMLLDSGRLRGGPAGLGVDTRPDGRVIASDGRADGLLWAIGPLRRGNLWESTAVGEIRAQAGALAEEIVGTATPTQRRPVDCYGLPLSTNAAAADAYRSAQEALLVMQDGAVEHLEDAVRADPGFALAHITLALLGHEWDVDVNAPRRLESARNAVAHRGDERERSWVRAVEARLCGLAEADHLLGKHVERNPRDAIAVGVALPTIAFGGLAQPEEQSWALADALAPSYGEDWWFTGVLAFFRQEQSRWSEAERLAEKSLALEHRSGHAAHARAHVSYETGEHATGMHWLDSWIASSAATSRYRGHFEWHAALHALALDDASAVRKRWNEGLGPTALSGGRALVDGVSMLWRAKVDDCWPGDDDPFARLPDVLATVPECLLERPRTPFAAMHAAIAHAATANLPGLHALAAHAGHCYEASVADVVRCFCAGLAAYVEGDAATAAARLAAVRPRTAKLGGSAAQQEVVDDTLIRALVDSGRVEEAAEVLDQRLARRTHPNDARRLARLRSAR